MYDARKKLVSCLNKKKDSNGYFKKIPIMIFSRAFQGSPSLGSGGSKGPLTRTKPRLTGIAKIRQRMKERSVWWEKRKEELEDKIRRAKQRAGRLSEEKERQKRQEDKNKDIRKTLGKKSFMSKMRNTTNKQCHGIWRESTQ